MDTLRRVPSSNPPVLPRPSFLLPFLRLNSSYVRPLAGSLSCLLFGLGFALAESRAFWSSGDACFLLRILKLACLSLAPSHGRCEFLIQNDLTTHPVSAAGAFTCTLDSPFLDLSIIYHTNVVLSIFFVRFIQQISPPVFYVLHNSSEIPAKSGPEQAASGPPVTFLPVPDHRAGSRGSGTGTPVTSTPPAPARPAPG